MRFLPWFSLASQGFEQEEAESGDDVAVARFQDFSANHVAHGMMSAADEDAIFEGGIDHRHEVLAVLETMQDQEFALLEELHAALQNVAIFLTERAEEAIMGDKFPVLFPPRIRRAVHRVLIALQTGFVPVINRGRAR